ncbi:hypothetical protein [Pseudomonas rhizophila]
MASKVLKSFLIGIGYDTKALEAGDKKINASLNGIKSGALGISGALIGAFGAAAGSVIGVARRVDQLALSTQNLRTSMNSVYNFGNAVQLMGGQASEALDALTRFEEFQNNIRLNGEDGSINELAKAGIDVLSLTYTRTGEEFMRELAEMLPRLDEGQRSQVQSTLGLSDAVFRSLAGGADNLDELMKKAAALTGSVDQLTDESRKLAENASEFGLIIEGIKNELAEEFLPSLIGAGSALNNFLKEYRDEIGGAIGYAADNAGATAVLGGSATAAVAGAAAAKLGLSTVGGAVSKAGTAGVAVTGSAIGANLLNRTLDENVPGYGAASRSFDELLKSVTGLDRIKGPLELISGGMGGSDVSQSPKVEQQPTDQSETYTGTVERSQEDIDYLNRRDGGDSQAPERTIEDIPSASAERRNDELFGGRSALDSIPPANGPTPEEDRQATAEALAGALSRTPVKVESHLNVNMQLDGQALESKIIQVNERQNYETLGDLKTTTER